MKGQDPEAMMRSSKFLTKESERSFSSPVKD